MILRKIKLENIRSYLSQEIEFPEGSVLLSGDIGSGKSTILLAIDFVLFGLRKDIGGGALLRNGKDQGSVELQFELEGKDIIIKRTLKRSKSGVTQESGELSIDGSNEEYSPIELKQKVLELLNYPQDLLTKTKALVYRYTVYTPQEEMKQILLVDKESRVDILRRVFGVDKYKRIKENVKIVSSSIRNKISKDKILITDLDNKIKEKEAKGKELEEINIRLEKELKEIKRKELILAEEKNKLKEIEDLAEEVNKLRKELDISAVNLSHKKFKKEELKKEGAELEKQIKDLNIKVVDTIDSKDLVKKEEEIKNIESLVKELIKKASEHNLKKRESELVKQNIKDLKNCPKCLQDVGDEHKKKILLKEETTIKEAEEHIRISSLKEKELEDKLKLLKAEVDLLKRKEHEIEIIKIKMKSQNEKKGRLEEISKISNVLLKEIGELEQKYKEAEIKLKKNENIKIIEKGVKNNIEFLRDDLKHSEIESITLQKDLVRIKEIHDNLTKEIEQKNKTKEKIGEISKLNDWLENNFLNLVGSIEKRVMIKLNYDFDKYFQKWFSMLVNDDIITVKLDNEFTPLIEQNGYDVDYEYLSGGEKTAAALSYRLALNQVINNLTTNLKTKDLIILDEPTDGFSNEQLDRIRPVLEELNVKQIIIVSHDPKVESFVDNVIKLDKKEHVSKTIS